MNLTNLSTSTENKLAQYCKVRAFSPGAIAKGLLKTYNETAIEVANSLDISIINASVSNAVGDRLDSIGILLGVERSGTSYAVGQLKFYINSDLGVDLDDLKDIIETRTGIRPTNITIPRGTEIKNEDSSKSYNTTSEISLTNNDVYVDAISFTIGSAGNVSSGELEVLGSISPEMFYIKDYIRVTNPLAIDSGSEREDDGNYRFRIVNSYSSHAAANDVSIRLAALSIPGVSDVFTKNYEYGIGTSTIYVLSESPIVSQGVLDAVQQVVNNVAASGNRIIVSSFEYKAISMQIVLEFKPNTTMASKDDITIKTRDNMIEYINNLGNGEEFVINELTQRIMETSPYIHDYAIKEMGVGEYNFSTGLIDYFSPTLPVNQEIDSNTKWVTNQKLLTICY